MRSMGASRTGTKNVSDSKRSGNQEFRALSSIRPENTTWHDTGNASNDYSTPRIHQKTQCAYLHKRLDAAGVQLHALLLDLSVRNQPKPDRTTVSPTALAQAAEKARRYQSSRLQSQEYGSKTGDSILGGSKKAYRANLLQNASRQRRKHRFLHHLQSERIEKTWSE
jgi:hypothetical protein